uniref:Uncharacterized protein n=1 Tax=Ciona intestinalis TaxID=7719 RepID=H2XYW4_CIOIN
RENDKTSQKSKISEKVATELLLFVNAGQENLLVCILESEVKSLGWEVTNNVCHVTSPEGDHALLFRDSNEAVHDPLVLIFNGNLFGSGLNLEQKFYSFNWGDDGFGNSRGCATDSKILGETFGAERHF